MLQATKFFILAAFLLFAAGKVQGASKVGCDPDDKSKWEWVFHYPEKGQEGQVLKMSVQALLDGRNLKAGHEQWMSGVALGLVSAEGMPEHLSGLTVYRDCSGGARIPKGSAIEYISSKAGGRVSKNKKRRVLSSALGFGAPVGLGVLTGGAAVLPYMFSGLPNMFFGSQGRTGDSVKTTEPNDSFRPYELYPGVKVRTRRGYSEVKVD